MKTSPHDRSLPERTGDVALEIRDGAVAIAGRPILRGIDLVVPAGQVLAVVGANGSGKSTLVRAVLGLRELTDGDVRLFGVPLREFRDWARIGYVPQHSAVAQGVPASVREVVTSGRIARRRPFRPQTRADREAVAAAIETVDLVDRTHSPVATLSGGQRQRVLVARTLAGDPDLLLLDEPNAGVDLSSQEAIAEALARRTAAGATAVLVLHELGPFASLIDRAVVLDQGRVAYDGPPERIVAAGQHHHHPPRPRPSVAGVAAPLEGEH